MNEVSLATMRWWHIAAVMALERELFEAEAWSEAAYWNELAETATRHYLVAVDGAGGPAGDRVVGYAGLAVYDDEAHVLTIGVTGAAQGRGVGTALLAELLAIADARGARKVLLDVRADNPAAQRLYARHGFVPIGRRRRYYQPSGVDAVVMARG